jgi:hypothetical protein
VIFCSLRGNPFFKVVTILMKVTTLYEQFLGLKSRWSVTMVGLSLADHRVVVAVVLKKGQVWADPTHGTKRTHDNG